MVSHRAIVASHRGRTATATTRVVSTICHLLGIGDVSCGVVQHWRWSHCMHLKITPADRRQVRQNPRHAANDLSATQIDWLGDRMAPSV